MPKFTLINSVLRTQKRIWLGLYSFGARTEKPNQQATRTNAQDANTNLNVRQPILCNDDVFFFERIAVPCKAMLNFVEITIYIGCFVPHAFPNSNASFCSIFCMENSPHAGGYPKSFIFFFLTDETVSFGDLSRLLFRKQGAKMVKGDRIVNIVCSSEFGGSIRVSWHCIEWANDYATIYDYSGSDGPTCIVPLRKIFSSSFIKELKTRDAYENNKGYWTSTFAVDKEIAQLVLNYKDRWGFIVNGLLEPLPEYIKRDLICQ